MLNARSILGVFFSMVLVCFTIPLFFFMSANGNAVGGRSLLSTHYRHPFLKNLNSTTHLNLST